MKEIWKSLKGLVENGDYYEVSNLGNVRSIDKMMMTKRGYLTKKHGRILKQTKNRNGYLTISLKLDGAEKKCEIQRLVAIAFLKNLDEKPIVNHKDTDPTNNCVDNLEWATQSENLIHAQKYGNKNDSGINHYASRLTKEDVSRIRELYKSGNHTLKEIGIIYEMSETSIWKIVKYKTYKGE